MTWPFENDTSGITKNVHGTFLTKQDTSVMTARSILKIISTQSFMKKHLLRQQNLMVLRHRISMRHSRNSLMKMINSRF